MDTSDPQDVARRAKAARQTDIQKRHFLRELMQKSAGRDWMFDLLSSVHIYHTPFARGAPDATAFALGEQNVGLRLMADLHSACPDLYLRMLGEQDERRNRDTDGNLRNASEPGQLARNGDGSDDISGAE
jgi:hypothetical protein